MSAARVVLFGYGPMAIAAIDVLGIIGAGPVLVVLPGNRSGEAVDHVAAHAATRGIAVAVQPRVGLAAFAERLQSLSPDVFVVWSYSMIIPQTLLDIPKRGTVNVHTALLPEYRGGHVLQWALLNDEHETGVTLHYVDAGVDTGPVIAERRFPIDSDDDARSVKEGLRKAGASLLREWWSRIADGTAPRTPQDESRARLWPLRKPEQGRIDLGRPAADVVRLVRALNANDPGAYLDLGAARVTVVRACAHPPAGVAGLRLRAADGEILVTEGRLNGRTLGPAELSTLLDRVSHSQPAR